MPDTADLRAKLDTFLKRDDLPADFRARALTIARKLTVLDFKISAILAVRNSKAPRSMTVKPLPCPRDPIL